VFGDGAFQEPFIDYRRKLKMEDNEEEDSRKVGRQLRGSVAEAEVGMDG
jgi:hypothetical protein